MLLARFLGIIFGAMAACCFAVQGWWTPALACAGVLSIFVGVTR